MGLNKDFLGEASEPLKAVEVNLSRAELLLMINSQVAVAAKHQGIIAFPLVGVHNASSSYFLEGHAKEGFRTYIWDYAHFYFSCSFEDTEDNNLVSCGCKFSSWEWKKRNCNFGFTFLLEKNRNTSAS